MWSKSWAGDCWTDSGATNQVVDRPVARNCPAMLQLVPQQTRGKVNDYELDNRDCRQFDEWRVGSDDGKMHHSLRRSGGRERVGHAGPTRRDLRIDWTKRRRQNHDL